MKKLILLSALISSGVSAGNGYVVSNGEIKKDGMSIKSISVDLSTCKVKTNDGAKLIYCSENNEAIVANNGEACNTMEYYKLREDGKIIMSQFRYGCEPYTSLGIVNTSGIFLIGG